MFHNIETPLRKYTILTTLQMFPSKGDVLHIPYGSYRPRSRKTSYTRKVIEISLLLHHGLPNAHSLINNNDNNFLFEGQD